MQYSCILILLITVTIIQTIFSSDTIDDDQNENKFDETQQISSLSLPFGKETNMPECLSKNHLLNMLDRNRRASISRPYFRRWRSARDSTRYSPKHSLAFSPRLGKRAPEDDNESNNADNKFVSRSIDIVYEDSTKVCLSQSISDVLIQQHLDKFDANWRNQDAHDKEDTRERQSPAKHPVLFRYRLG